MPLAIKGSPTTYNSCPTHDAGDLLLAFQWGSGTPSIASGWTQTAGYATSWSYEAHQVGYRVATDAATVAPFLSGFSSGGTRIYAITGFDLTNPIAGEAHGEGTAQPFTIPSITVPGATAGSGGSAYLGSGQWIAVPNAANLQMSTGNFTIECWWRPDNLTGTGNYQSVFGKGYSGVAGGLYAQTGYADGKLNIVTNSTTILTSSTAVTPGVWTHIALVRNGSTMTLYQNGVSVGSATNSTDFNATDPLTIGNCAANYTYSANGYISNFRIVKGTAVYTSAFTPATSALTNITNTTILTCQSQTTLTDASSNNYTVTMNGGYVSPKSIWSTALPANSLRFTLVNGVGGGGNPGLSTSVCLGDSFTNVLNNSYYQFWSGGVGPMVVNTSTWLYRYSTVSINPAKTSGFFSMF